MDIITLGGRDELCLKETASAIADINDSVLQLSQAMLETMHEGKGVGLAGPQVGFVKRIFVTHAQGDQDRVFINPDIIQTSLETVTYEEGCLSIPGVYAEVVRPAGIVIQGWNEKGRPFKLTAEGILARIIQHEYDHLRGVLFLDRINEKRRERILKSYGRKIKSL
ncbi:MAG: peptide deformylase [Spirochaetales bacterium]|jgi:peptide deformylase|nr:peptide deformylase [Spirochaetales bacterium]